MIPHIDHEAIADLKKRVWRYWLDPYKMRLELDHFTQLERPTKRHGWQIVEEWDRLARPQDRGGKMKRADVPVPESVRDDVLRRFRESITIE
jgi:hypothetical protein